MTVTTLQIIQVITALISACLASTALLYSMVAYTKNLKVSHYNELDKAYQTVLTFAFNNMYLVKHELIVTQEQQEKYDIYAFMVWNFLEAIYDKCMKDKHLKETWEPIMRVEGRLHYKWLMREDNSDKFKPILYKYVNELLYPQENGANINFNNIVTTA